MSRAINPRLRQDQQGLPNRPGVYLFLDTGGHPLYIGKSVRLRQRVASYLREDQTGLEERIERMVHEAQCLRYIETETELLALLLEDALIKKHLPTYNIKQKQFRDYQYVLITDEPYPRMKRLDGNTQYTETIYGPFRDRFFVDRLQEIFSRYLGFRSCQDAHPKKRCMELDIGHCLGPCVLPDVLDEYIQVSDQVRDFLSGTDPGVTQGIESELQDSIRDLRYEHASRLRDDLIFCDAFFHRQRFNHRFRINTLRIKARDGKGPRYLFQNGALTEVVLKGGRISRPGEQLDIFDLSVVKEDDPRFILDRANLVYQWLRKNQQDVAYDFDSGS